MKFHILMPNEIEKLEFSVSKEWQKFADKSPWAACVLETAITPEGQRFIRKKGNNISYIDIDKGYKCVQCDSDIMSARVAHSIWDDPFSCSGSGGVHNEDVPYCPKCENKPNLHGSPILC